MHHASVPEPASSRLTGSIVLALPLEYLREVEAIAAAGGITVELLLQQMVADNLNRRRLVGAAR